jgi:hypothetical protein
MRILESEYLLTAFLGSGGCGKKIRIALRMIGYGYVRAISELTLALRVPYSFRGFCLDWSVQ